ncbi:MAG: hypothetical protein QOE70_632 [Chthoniobacter sp.]|jgi:hypothetical protein|nr:hypothetical protein [Chthoniobacter sp.]
MEMKTRGLIVAGLALMWAGVSLGADSESLVFGSTEKTSGSLIGIFYDLKQNQQRQAVKADYLRTMGEFLDSGWDEAVLSRFFRGTKPIYATEVFIPWMGAGAAPKAFELEKIVRPEQWFVIYKGQVSPPEDGTYRFVGLADDVLAVAVNGKTELVSNFGNAQTSKWREAAPAEAIKVEPGKLRRGDWFEARKGKIVDLDILIGEHPGTAFGAWLLIERKGVKYPVVTDPKFGEQQVLPVFQVKKTALVVKKKDVPFSTDAEPWVCHQ